MMQTMTLIMKTWYCIACTTHHLSGVHISPSKKLTFVTCCKNRSQWKKSIEEAYEAASSLYHTQPTPQRDSFLHLLPDNGDEDGNDGNICDHGFKYSPISTKMWISTVDGFIFYLLLQWRRCPCLTPSKMVGSRVCALAWVSPVCCVCALVLCALAAIITHCLFQTTAAAKCPTLKRPNTPPFFTLKCSSQSGFFGNRPSVDIDT